jgi:predicted HicB family RNase H-like nuclease
MARTQLHLRLPNSLLEQLRAQADEEGTSLNLLMTSVLAGAVGWKPDKKTARRR